MSSYLRDAAMQEQAAYMGVSVWVSSMQGQRWHTRN